MELEEMYHELKNDRQILRKRIHKAICNQVVLAAKGGFFPSFDIIINSICEEIALMMDEHEELDAHFWSIILQAREPDATCEKFKRFIDEWEKKEKEEV